MRVPLRKLLRSVLSLRGMIVAIMLLSVAPLLLVHAWRLAAGVHEQRDRTAAELSRAAAEVAASIDHELQSSIDALLVLSQSELFQQSRIAALGRLLQGRPRRDWDSIFLLDRDGSVVLDTRPGRLPPGMRTSMQELRERVVRTRGSQVSGAAVGPPSPENAISVALPVMQGNSVRYVLGARMSDSTWARAASPEGVPARASVTLLDATGQLIARSGAEPPSANDDGSSYSAWRTIDRSGWQVRVALAAEPIDGELQDMLLRSLVLDGGAAALGLALASVVARAVLRRAEKIPHEALTHEVRNRVAAIRAAADVLQAAPPGSPDSAQAHEVLVRQTHRLSELQYDEQRGSNLKPVEPPATTARTARTAREQLHVLIVSDDRQQVASLREQLQRQGATVTIAADGVEGLSRLLSLKPPLALVSVALPGISGLDLARQSRAAGYAGRLIAIDPDAACCTEREALVAGFDGSTATPIDEETLLELFRNQ